MDRSSTARVIIILVRRRDFFLRSLFDPQLALRLWSKLWALMKMTSQNRHLELGNDVASCAQCSASDLMLLPPLPCADTGNCASNRAPVRLCALEPGPVRRVPSCVRAQVPLRIHLEQWLWPWLSLLHAKDGKVGEDFFVTFLNITFPTLHPRVSSCQPFSILMNFGSGKREAESPL